MVNRLTKTWARTELCFGTYFQIGVEYEFVLNVVSCSDATSPQL